MGRVALVVVFIGVFIGSTDLAAIIGVAI